MDNDLTGLTHAFVAGTGPGSTAFTYGYDASGKVTSIGINQPVFEWMPTLAYARTYGAADNRNRIGTVSDPTEARTLTWNPDGDLTQEVRTKTGQPPVTWTYHWTYGHRLAGVTNDAPAAALTATYSYDSDDRRTKTVVNGLLTYTLWSGTNELAQYDGSRSRGPIRLCRRQNPNRRQRGLGHGHGLPFVEQPMHPEPLVMRWRRACRCVSAAGRQTHLRTLKLDAVERQIRELLTLIEQERGVPELH